MFKIGEFSRITQVSVRMLRYYDEQKLLVPKVLDQITGYRYYAAEQIESLNRIILLRDMGFGIKEMKSMLNHWSKESLMQYLEEQSKKQMEVIETEKRKLIQLQGMIKDLQNDDKKINIEIIMRTLKSQNVYSLRRVVDNYYCEGTLWEEFLHYITPLSNKQQSDCMSIYHDLDDREEHVDIEVCVSSDHYKVTACHSDIEQRNVEQVPMAACFMVYGPYSNISKAYREFAEWLEKHPEYEMSGENRQICHVASNVTDNPEEYVTELQIPLSLK